MAGDVVQMDYSTIGAVSKGFTVQSAALKAIAKALEIAIQILQAMAFVSLGTTKAMAQYLSVIKQKVQNLAKLCDEFAKDLSLAISDHKKGDVTGKRYFGEGIS